MIYPSAHDIEQYFAHLAAEVQDELRPLLESAQANYRRVWQEQSLNEDGRIEVLRQVAADVFKMRTAKRLRHHSGEFEAFRSAISLEGGEAELGFWCAHRLYNLVERGRMLAIWHREIQSHLWDRIREAENLWYSPELVAEGWEKFIAPAVPQPASPPEADREPPSAFFEAYRAKNPTMTYGKLASRIGIARDSLFRIKDEKAWVRVYAYEAAARELGCRPVRPSSAAPSEISA